MTILSLVSDLELSEDDAKQCNQIITDTASTLKAASEEIQQLVDDLAKVLFSLNDNENHLHL